MTTTSLAVLLSAGIGSRLRPLTDDRPKSLVSVGGEPILLRAVRTLVDHGVREIVLATGYREDALRHALAEAPIPVRYCRNDAFESTQNSVSLSLCEPAIDNRGFYLLDGDVLFHPDILSRLDAHSADLAVAVERRDDMGEEEMKVIVEAEKVKAFGKGLDPKASLGESIGIARIGERAAKPLFEKLGEAIRAGQTSLYYEDVFNHLIESGLSVMASDITDLPWIEIDTKEDLERAKELVAKNSFARSA